MMGTPCYFSTTASGSDCETCARKGANSSGPLILHAPPQGRCSKKARRLGLYLLQLLPLLPVGLLLQLLLLLLPLLPVGLLLQLQMLPVLSLGLLLLLQLLPLGRLFLLLLLPLGLLLLVQQLPLGLLLLLPLL